MRRWSGAGGLSLASVGVVVGVVVAADPVGAHHGRDDMASVEAMARLAATDPSRSAALPTPLILAASAALLGLAVMAHRRRRRRSGASPAPVPGFSSLRSGARGHPRRVAAAVAAAALFAVSLTAISAPAGAASMLLPDLISDEPDPAGGVEVNTWTGTPRLVLRFDGYVTNVGDGPLEVSGNPQITNPTDPAAVHQRAIDTAGDWHVVGTPPVQFETADGHNPFHLREVGRYSLWNEARTAEAAPGQKVGFCLYDIERAEAEDYDGPSNPRVYSGTVTQFCDADNPSTTDLVMGTSAGWRDVYAAYLTFQWIDVSETAPGRYYLANEADPYDRVVESDETNNQVAFAGSPSVVPGYNALPVAGATTAGQPVAISLAAEQFGSPGPRQFEIVVPPQHGTLDVAPGVGFTGPTVTYTPAPGHDGSDSFEYVARDGASAFPLTPTRAAVAIIVGDGSGASVEISGAPASLIAGTSAALTATIANGTGPVDAVFKALAELTETKSELLQYQVKAITGGMDAQGEVTVTLEEDGRRVIGHGAHTDIIVASARAYVHAINRLDGHKERREVDGPRGI